MTDVPSITGAQQTPLAGLSPTRQPGWQQLQDAPLLVLVGVTGVGKSTALSALPEFGLLPDRRDLTDAVMILPLAGRPVQDREERFALSARYRQAHPGGMAQALGSLWAEQGRLSGGLIFDGLRGQEEVAHAAQHAPAWRFVSLHAPDVVRVRRLLGRGDRFDQVGAAPAQGGADQLRSELGGLSGANSVFSEQELDELAALTSQGHPPEDILAKTRIVLSERRNYDPLSARAVLARLPGWRALDLDSHALSPQQVAQHIRAWLPEGP